MADTIVAGNVVKRYGDLAAVDDVSISVGHGEFFGILGPNGAGKTTLLEIIEGLREAAFIPLESAPDWLVTVSKFLPMGYLVGGMKDVMVRGEPASAAFLPIVILLGFAVVITAIATRVFKWDTA